MISNKYFSVTKCSKGFFEKTVYEKQYYKNSMADNDFYCVEDEEVYM